MQLISNIALYVMPALPVAHGGDPRYVMDFVWVEVAIAAFVVIRYGPKDMGLGPRPTWTDPKIPDWNPARKKVADGQLATA